MATASFAPTARTLEVPGARLYYEVRGKGPLLVLAGAPMDARSFGPLAGLLAGDYTVLTTDPRGINRSPVDDPGQDSTPQMRADDLSRLVTHLDAGPAVVLGSSGGAVSALALVQAHPGQVRTVVAHEPPLIELLPDRAERHAGNEDVIARWLAGDHVGSWRVFLENANIRLPEGVFEAVFGAEPDPQAVADTTYQNTRMLRPTTHFLPDIAALRAAGSRVVVGIGEGSAGQVCDRTSRALAAALGIEPTMFPGGHTGFAEDPGGFAVRLRSVLQEGLQGDARAGRPGHCGTDLATGPSSGPVSGPPCGPVSGPPCGPASGPSCGPATGSPSGLAAGSPSGLAAGVSPRPDIL